MLNWGPAHKCKAHDLLLLQNCTSLLDNIFVMLAPVFNEQNSKNRELYRIVFRTNNITMFAQCETFYGKVTGHKKKGGGGVVSKKGNTPGGIVACIYWYGVG